MDKKLLRKELLAVRQEIAATRPEAAKELAWNIVGWLEANPQFSTSKINFILSRFGTSISTFFRTKRYPRWALTYS